MRTTLDQFCSIFRKAEEHFGVKNLSKKVYYDKIQYYAPNVVSDAVNGLVDTAPPLLSKFPTPIALLVACKEVAGRGDKSNKAKTYGCDAIGCNHGFVSFYRFKNYRRTNVSNPCAYCFPLHSYPQVVIVDHAVAHATRREGKKFKADLTTLRYIPDTQFLDEDQFVEYLQKGMHRIPGEFIATAKPKPKQVYREQPSPDMVKAQARDMLKNLIGVNPEG